MYHLMELSGYPGDYPDVGPLVVGVGEETYVAPVENLEPFKVFENHLFLTY